MKMKRKLMKKAAGRPRSGSGAALRMLPAGAVPTVLLMAFLSASALGFSGCGKPGQDGASYLALDWVYAPQGGYFPMLPSAVTPGTYYEHPAGSYPGEYIAWDGSYYSFTYTIAVNPGEPGELFLDGADGADRYYTMWLYSWGPELYYYDAAALALAVPGGEGALAAKVAAEKTRMAGEQRRTVAAQAAGAGTGQLPGAGQPLDNGRPLPERLPEPSAAGGQRERYLYESVGPDCKLRIEGWGRRAQQN